MLQYCCHSYVFEVLSNFSFTFFRKLFWNWTKKFKELISRNLDQLQLLLLSSNQPQQKKKTKNKTKQKKKNKLGKKILMWPHVFYIQKIKIKQQARQKIRWPLPLRRKHWGHPRSYKPQWKSGTRDIRPQSYRSPWDRESQTTWGANLSGSAQWSTCSHEGFRGLQHEGVGVVCGAVHQCHENNSGCEIRGGCMWWSKCWINNINQHKEEPTTITTPKNKTINNKL